MTWEKIIRILTNEADLKEQQAFESWVNAHPDNQDLFCFLQENFKELQTSLPATQVQQEWEAVSLRLKTIPQSSTENIKSDTTETHWEQVLWKSSFVLCLIMFFLHLVLQVQGCTKEPGIPHNLSAESSITHIAPVPPVAGVIIKQNQSYPLHTLNPLRLNYL